MKSVVLIATFNGEQFLRKQLDSIINQTEKCSNILISDDGSSDGTKTILRNYSAKYNFIDVINGNRLGFVGNFFNLINSVSEEFDMYFFADQDDIWNADRVRHIKKKFRYSDSKPSIYFSDTEIIDKNEIFIGRTKKKFKPSFKNSLVESAGGGNTMVINRDCLKLIKKSIEFIDDNLIVSHDWWMYQVISGCNGHIFYDSIPNVLYRQHDTNIQGSKIKFLDKLHRIKRLSRGDLTQMLNQQLYALSKIDFLDPKNKILLNQFLEKRSSVNSIKYTRFLIKNSIFRSSWIENVVFLFASFFKKG
jgi:glycosyltransferase involved in cell wall biosynthesis